MAAPFRCFKTLRLFSAVQFPQATAVRFKSRGLIPRRKRPIKKWFDPADKSWAEPIYSHHEQKQGRPEQEASMLHMVYRIKDHYTRPFWEKDILKEFGLYDKAYTPVVLKNTPDVNGKLRQVQHLLRIKPVTFPYGLPKSESDYKHCFLNEHGEFVVKHQLQEHPAADTEQAWTE
ncbi:39S ribosomal protein L30, mitochondrial, partial [Elysia marginata]